MDQLLLRLARVLLLLAVVGGLAAAVALPNPLNARAEVPPESPVREVPFTDLNPIGANFFHDREVEAWKREQTMRLAKEAGVGWARILFSWEGIEPRRGSFFDEGQRRSSWDKYDELVGLAERYGMRIIARLDRTPEWAREPGTTQTAPPTNVDDYGRFVGAVASRYAGRIQHFQIWNEPNLRSEWGEQPASPRGYLELLRTAHQAIKAANRDALVLSAPMAQTLDNANGNRTDLAFVEDMYRLGWSRYFDILSANAYGFDRPPSDPAHPDVLNFARLDLVRDIMVRNGDERKPVWIAEFGWNAAPANYPSDRLFWRRVTEEEQARYTAEGLRLARQRPWVGVINVWFFRQVGDISPVDDSAYFFRVVDTDFTPRLPFFALTQLAGMFKTAGPGWFEETAGPVTRIGAWRDRLDDRASGRGYMTPVNSESAVRLQFVGTQVTVSFFGERDCGRFAARVDRGSEQQFSVPAAGPPQVVVASGLPLTAHTLEIAALDAGSGGCGIDAFQVSAEQPGTPGYVVALLVAAVSAGLLGITGLAVRRS